MNYYLIFCIILLCCISIIILAIRNIKSLTKQIEKLENLEKEELKEYFKEETNEFEVRRAELKGELSKLQCVLAEKESRYEEINQDLEVYREGRLKEIDSAGAEYEERKRLIVDNAVDNYRTILIGRATKDINSKVILINQTDEQLAKIREELEEERRKRAAVNEEILRQRALDEQQDFYRIQLDPNDKDDVEILRSVAPRLRHPEAVNKVIWSAYYQKPLAELRKRVAIESSGVYKITRIKTGEIYIGQAVNVSTRWADHVKSALGVGTLTSSQLHRVMFEDGPENFTFELLEEVSKDKLRERESYYIDFYDSKTYGLNTLSGDKK